MARMYLYFFILLATFIAGFSCENSFCTHLQHAQLRESVKPKFEGFNEKDKYGIVSRSRWNKTDDTIMVHVTMSHCSNLYQCLAYGPLREYVGDSQPGYKFDILPSGQIVKKSDWDKDNLGNVSVNLVARAMEGPQLDHVTLEAYAFLMQVGVSLGKVKKSFSCQASERTMDNEVLVDLIKQWCHSYRNIFDKDLFVYRTPVIDDEEVVFRSDWDPIEPIRDMDIMKVEAEMVEVHMTYHPCSLQGMCTEAAQELRREQTKKHGDLSANFIFCGDGRVLEGLGWNSTKVEKVVQFHFIVNSQDFAPKKMSLFAFGLQISEGVRLGKISEEFKLDLTSIGNGTIAEEIEKWVAWSRKALVEYFVATAPSASGKETNVTMRNEEVDTPLRHPIGHVLFTTSSGDVDSIPFIRSLWGKAIRSAKQVRSNFYFAGDEVAYEGLGWNHTATKDEVVFEFLISDPQALPSNQTMLLSTFLMREGVKRGFLRADYELTVAEHTSIEFENMVRLWDGRVRGEGDLNARRRM